MIPSHKPEHAPGIRIPQDERLIASVQTRLAAYHSGKAKAVKSHRIEKALSISGAKLRAIVNYLNTRGVPVCSCGEGYYFAQTADEVTEYVNSLRSRVRGITNRIEGLTA